MKAAARTKAGGRATKDGADGRRVNRHNTTDPLSDRATTMLIRKVLCPQTLKETNRETMTPIEEVLPPLTSRNDVDLQLYAFLAIILKEFVQNWYNKITPDDTFVAEIVHTIAHCTRALEQRLRKVDLESLLLDEVPDLLDRHVTAYRASQQSMTQPPVETNPRAAYHAMCPLPQLSPVPRDDMPSTKEEQLKNEAEYRQLLVQAILAILLPTEDLENPCLTSLVEQIFSELIIGNNIANKASQPWLLYECICITARVLGEKKTRAAQRIVSGSSAAAMTSSAASKKPVKWSVQAIILAVLHMGIVIVSALRTMIGAFVMSSSLPSRLVRISSKEEEYQDGDQKSQVPILDCKLWQCAGNLVELGSRMPWLSGFLSLVQHLGLNGPGRIAKLDGALDRLLSHNVQWLFLPSHLTPILRTLRGVAFPNNAPGTPSLFPPSSDIELVELRQRAARAIIGLLPASVARMYLGNVGFWRNGSRSGDTTQDPLPMQSMVEDVEGLLMVISDDYCNKHLMYSLLELILVRLVPELSDKGVVELWEERLG